MKQQQAKPDTQKADHQDSNVRVFTPHVPSSIPLPTGITRADRRRVAAVAGEFLRD